MMMVAGYWRGLTILPLLFVYGNSQFLFPDFGNPLTGIKTGDVQAQDKGQMGAADGGSSDGNGGDVQAADNGQVGAADGGSSNVNGGDAQAPDMGQVGAADGGSSDGNGVTTNTLDVGSMSPTETQSVSVNDNKMSTSVNGVATGEPAVAQTTFKGSWELFIENSGVSAMHVILLPLINQVCTFDATIWKKSYLKLPGPPCRKVEGTNEEDCFAHSVLIDVDTGKLKPLRVQHDTWCSSGALDINGRIVSTGGYNNGSDTVRILDICPTCDWQEYPDALANGRWYSTQVTLADGRFVVFGGRDFRTYEFVPAEGQKNTLKDVHDFKFLVETQDPEENNLYPFVFLSTDGNLYIFANNRSILLNPNTHQIIYEFPVLPNGARNYPASGCATLLPIMLQPNENRRIIPAEVLVCGGAAHNAFFQADRLRPKVFMPANTDCARIDVTKRNGRWKITNMPSPRVIGDMAVLPTGDVLIINGAKSGSAGWDNARDPNFNPVLYKFKTTGVGSKFTELAPSNIPRMYHSTYVVLPDSKILVAGSNTNDGYIEQALYPTEVRVEKFSPHYLDPQLSQFRQDIVVEKSASKVKYGQMFTVHILEGGAIDRQKLQVTIYSPPFTTHGISMNQRLVQLAIHEFNNGQISLQAPLNGNIAPPGYYMLYVNYNGVPCKRAMWIQITP